MKKKKNTEEKRDLRELFLEKFVESLILHIEIPEEETQEEIVGAKLTENLIEIPSEFKVSQGIIPQIATTKMLAPLFPTAQQQPQQSQLIKTPFQLSPQHPALQQPLAQHPLTQHPLQQQLPPHLQYASPSEKVAFLLRDPAVASIECPGPDKNLIVRKFGAIQTAPLILTQEEINNIINEFSEKTRIPLIEGIFKAAVANMIITAVISEFVGTRFIIEKTRPAPMPMRYF